jgi:hypothetical protein
MSGLRACNAHADLTVAGGAARSANWATLFCSALRPLQPPDRANWHPECLAAEDKRRAQEADDVADVVMFEFMADELTWQLVELTIAAKVMRPGPVHASVRTRASSRQHRWVPSAVTIRARPKTRLAPKRSVEHRTKQGPGRNANCP